MASISFRPGARLAIPRPANWALWLGVGVGPLVGLLLWQQRSAGPPPAEVLRYTRALEPGTVLAAEHLGRTPARLDPAVLDRLVPALTSMFKPNFAASSSSAEVRAREEAASAAAR